MTSQHVGRLRECSSSSAVFDQYEGLYWSHFEAALDWNDAEMVEGHPPELVGLSDARQAVETLGNAGDPPQDAAIETDEDAATPFDDGEAAGAGPVAGSAQSPPRPNRARPDRARPRRRVRIRKPPRTTPCSTPSPPPSPPSGPASRCRSTATTAELDWPTPRKCLLAIISSTPHWLRETTPEAVIEC